MRVLFKIYAEKLFARIHLTYSNAQKRSFSEMKRVKNEYCEQLQHKNE
jgi:hypothetical protein